MDDHYSHLIGLVGQHSNLHICEVRSTGCANIHTHTLPIGQFWDLLRVRSDLFAFSSWSTPWNIVLGTIDVRPGLFRANRSVSVTTVRNLSGHETYSWRLGIIPISHPFQSGLLISTGQDGTVRLWNVEVDGGSEPIVVFRRNDDSSKNFTACNCEFSEAKSNIYTIGRSPPDLLCWNVEKCVFVGARPMAHKDQCFAMSQTHPFDSVLPAGIWTGSDDHNICFWPLAEFSENMVQSLKFSSEDTVRGIWRGPHEYLVFGEGYGKNCYCWDLRRPSERVGVFPVFTEDNYQSSCVKQVDDELEIMCSINYAGEVSAWKKMTGKVLSCHKDSDRHYGLRRLWDTPYEAVQDVLSEAHLQEEEVERISFIISLIDDGDGTFTLMCSVVVIGGKEVRGFQSFL